MAEFKQNKYKVKVAVLLVILISILLLCLSGMWCSGALRVLVEKVKIYLILH